jgi:hypothetical protein
MFTIPFPNRDINNYVPLKTANLLPIFPFGRMVLASLFLPNLLIFSLSLSLSLCDSAALLLDTGRFFSGSARRKAAAYTQSNTNTE